MVSGKCIKSNKFLRKLGVPLSFLNKTLYTKAEIDHSTAEGTLKFTVY